MLLIVLSGVALCQDTTRTYEEIVADSCKGRPDGQKVTIDLYGGRHVTVVCGKSTNTSGSEFEPLQMGQGELSASFAVIGRGTNSSPFYPGFEFDGGVSLNPYLTIVGEYNMDFSTALRLQEGSTPVLQEVRKNNTLATLTTGARANLMNRGRVIPFVQFTAGLFHAFTADANGFGYAPGAGVIVRATPHCDVKFEFKGDLCRGCRLDPAETFGIGYRF